MKILFCYDYKWKGQFFVQGQVWYFYLCHQIKTVTMFAHVTQNKIWLHFIFSYTNIQLYPVFLFVLYFFYSMSFFNSRFWYFSFIKKVFCALSEICSVCSVSNLLFGLNHSSQNLAFHRSLIFCQLLLVSPWLCCFCVPVAAVMVVTFGFPSLPCLLFYN